MSATLDRPLTLRRPLFYYGWVNLFVAAAAMTGTFPGRTHGLGLITSYLCGDLNITFFQYGVINFVAIVLGVSICGTISAWLSGAARIPFVAGIDRYLPSAFSRLHPRHGTPHVSLIAQAAAASFAILLSFVGSNVKAREAYSTLLALTVFANLVPFVYLYAALMHAYLHAIGEEQTGASFKQLTEDMIGKLNADHLRSKASGSRVTRSRIRSFG